MVKLPALPLLIVEAPKLLGVKLMGLTPINSIDSSALTLKFPPAPFPKVEDDTNPPSIPLKRPVDTVMFPPLPSLNVEAVMTLEVPGLKGEAPINSRESEAFKVILPPFALL